MWHAVAGARAAVDLKSAALGERVAEAEALAFALRGYDDELDKLEDIATAATVGGGGGGRRREAAAGGPGNWAALSVLWKTQLGACAPPAKLEAWFEPGADDDDGAGGVRAVVGGGEGKMVGGGAGGAGGGDPSTPASKKKAKKKKKKKGKKKGGAAPPDGDSSPGGGMPMTPGATPVAGRGRVGRRSEREVASPEVDIMGCSPSPNS